MMKFTQIIILVNQLGIQATNSFVSLF